jgi:methionine-rich copper-binding protein CopC
VYVGGAFTGGVAALDALTGALKWLGDANGDVRALALNGGRLLLGGAFTTVGGTTHRKLAAVNAATGAVDNAFKPAPGGTVRDIVVVNGIAYFGGQFTNLGAVDATTGTAVPGFTFSTNGQVYALGTDGTRLYIGGKFTAVNGLTRNTLASVTLATSTLDPWAPAAGCAITNCNVIWDLTVDVPRHRVYTVGRNPGTLYTVDTATAGVVFRAPGAFNGDSQAVTLAPDGHVYVGGHYVRVTIRGVVYDRMLVSEWDVSGTTPVIQPFSTRFVTSYPGVWAMASTNARLYVGGDFTQAGAQKRFPYFAMFPNGAADTTAPTVTATGPADNATGVVSPTDVTATFSEPVLNVSGTTFTLAAGTTPVQATVSSDSTTVARLHPSQPLAAGTYTATLTSGITDAAGNALTPKTWTFTTLAPTDTTAPTVINTIPKNNATGVSRTNNITAAFSEMVTNVNTTTFTLTPTNGTTNVSAKVTYNSTGDRWVLNPDVTLSPTTSYTATITSGVTDLAGNAFAGTTWTFTTGA